MSVENTEIVNGVARPRGWVFDHERGAELIGRDGWMCERHPGLEFPHDDCPGPGMAWVIEGKQRILEVMGKESHTVTLTSSDDDRPHILWFGSRVKHDSKAAET